MKVSCDFWIFYRRGYFLRLVKEFSLCNPKYSISLLHSSNLITPVVFKTRWTVPVLNICLFNVGNKTMYLSPKRGLKDDNRRLLVTDPTVVPTINLSTRPKKDFQSCCTTLTRVTASRGSQENLSNEKKRIYFERSVSSVFRLPVYYLRLTILYEMIELKVQGDTETNMFRFETPISRFYVSESLSTSNASSNSLFTSDRPLINDNQLVDVTRSISIYLSIYPPIYISVSIYLLCISVDLYRSIYIYLLSIISPYRSTIYHYLLSIYYLYHLSISTIYYL